MCRCKCYVDLYILQSIYISVAKGTSSVPFYVDVCPGFGWDRVNFLTAGTAVCFGFAIEFLLTTHWLLTNAYPKSRTFWCLMLSQRGSAQGAGGAWPGQVT